MAEQRQRSKKAIRRELLFGGGGARERCFLEVEAFEANWRFRRAAEPAPPTLHAVSCLADGQHLVCCDDVEVFLIKRTPPLSPTGIWWELPLGGGALSEAAWIWVPALPPVSCDLRERTWLCQTLWYGVMVVFFLKHCGNKWPWAATYK